MTRIVTDIDNMLARTRRPTLTERLAWFAPDKPDGISDDDHVNRWVLDLAARNGTTPSAAVAAILSGQWPAERRPIPRQTAEHLDLVEVLDLAARLGVSTSAAADIMSAPGALPRPGH